MFPTTPFDPSPKDAFSSSFVAEVGIFFSILLFQLSIFYSFIPEALCCCSLQPIILFVKIMFSSFHFQSKCCPNRTILSLSILFLTGALCPFAQILFILSSLVSLFNRSAIRNRFFLIPLSLWSASNFVLLHGFFLSFCLTSQGSSVSLVCQRSNLVYLSSLLFCCFPGAILDLGTRSSHSGGVL